MDTQKIQSLMNDMKEHNIPFSVVMSEYDGPMTLVACNGNGIPKQQFNYVNLLNKAMSTKVWDDEFLDELSALHDLLQENSQEIIMSSSDIKETHSLEMEYDLLFKDRVDELRKELDDDKVFGFFFIPLLYNRISEREICVNDIFYIAYNGSKYKHGNHARDISRDITVHMNMFIELRQKKDALEVFEITAMQQMVWTNLWRSIVLFGIAFDRIPEGFLE